MTGLALATLVLASNGHHYWHEVRFSYAADRFPLHDILNGEFNPHQFGHQIDEVSSAGFYRTKFLHVASLKALFSVVPPERSGFAIAIVISFLLVALTALTARQIFWYVTGEDAAADLGLAAFLLSPVVPYMSGMLMSEVPATFFAALAVLTGQRALSTEPARRFVWTISSGFLTLLAVLSRLDLIILICGFWVAVLITESGFARKRHVLKVFGIASGFAVVGFGGFLALLGVDARPFVQYFREFVGTGVKSPLMSFVGIISFGGWMYLTAILGVFDERRKATQLFVIWFLVSAGTMVVITSRYMVEPRYLIHGLIPFAGLAGLGLQAARRRFLVGLKVAFGVALVMIATNWAVVRLMPYELNRPQILAAVQDILSRDSAAAILTPWAYTDFHFLKVMKPDLAVYDVNGDLVTTNDTSLSAEWQRRATDWYGDCFLNSPDRLEAMLHERPVYYLGWHKYPPIETTARWMRAVGLSRMANRIAAFPSKDHLTDSWVWKSGRYEFREIGRSGQYVYYKIAKTSKRTDLVRTLRSFKEPLELS